MKQKMTIRKAQISDASALARLGAELGYPSTTAEMKHRLKLLGSNSDHGIFIAEDTTLLGWVNVSLIETLESESFAEIRGLVVTALHRGQGIGTELVAAAERWADKKGCKRIRVRTNVVRAEARAFYKKLGYNSVKTQDVFDKAPLSEE